MNEDKATRYHRLRRRSELAGTMAEGLVLAGLLASSVSLPPVFLFALVALVEFPFAFYQGYLLEHRYGLSTQSVAHWAGDHLKGVGLSLALALVAVALLYGSMYLAGDAWWAVAALLGCVAMIGIVQLAPVLLMPLFYAFKPLDRPALAARLIELSRRAGADVIGVFEWTLSGHTRKANAALAGLGRTRRILLADTLLADYSDDEIEVILAHELSHHVHHDLWRGVALQSASMFGGFFVAAVILDAAIAPLGLSGRMDPGALPLLMLVGGLWSLLMLPLANALSRRQERQADRYALETTRNAPAFLSAMKRLSQQNLAEDDPSPLVKALFYSHPPIRERLAAARAWGKVTSA